MNQSIKKIIYFPITKILIGITCCFLLLVGVQNFVTKPLFYNLLNTKSIADTIINYISVAVLLFAYYFVFHIYEKRKIKELSVKHFPKEFFGGLFFGFITLSFVILILYLLGFYTFISISNFSYFLAPLSFLIVAALIEEIFFRLIIFRILENWIGTYIALIVISVIFTLPHLFNDHVTVVSVLSLLLFGFTHSIMYTYTKRLWLPFAFHLGWNFAQPFYGSNLSGMDSIGSIIKSTFDGPILLTGSDFGIEDSILSIFFLIMISLIFLYLSIKESKIIKIKKLEV
jgi:hypothetical protein